MNQFLLHQFAQILALVDCNIIFFISHKTYYHDLPFASINTLINVFVIEYPRPTIRVRDIEKFAASTRVLEDHTHLMAITYLRPPRAITTRQLLEGFLTLVRIVNM